MFLLLIEKMKCVNKKNSYLLLNIWMYRLTYTIYCVNL